MSCDMLLYVALPRINILSVHNTGVSTTSSRMFLRSFFLSWPLIWSIAGVDYLCHRGVTSGCWEAWGCGKPLVLNISTTAAIDGRSLGFSLVQSTAVLNTRSICDFCKSLVPNRSTGSSTASPKFALFSFTNPRTHEAMCMGSPKLGSTGRFPVRSSNSRMPYEYTSTFGESIVPNPASAAPKP